MESLLAKQGERKNLRSSQIYRQLLKSRTFCWTLLLISNTYRSELLEGVMMANGNRMSTEVPDEIPHLGGNNNTTTSEKAKKEHHFSNHFHRRLFLIALISLAAISLFWISSEFARFRKNAANLRSEYIAEQKEAVKNDVNNVLALLAYNQQLTRQQLLHNTREHVYQACAIAENIYQKNKDTRSIAEIEMMIKDALRPVRYNNGRGYLFAVSLDGVEKLYPVEPQLEEKNLLNLQDEKGNYVIRDEIALIKKQGEGFVRDYWRKPDAGDAMIYPKISFVKHFPLLNWYFGSGDYLDGMQKEIQQESLKFLENMLSDGDKYIFVNTYDGDALIRDGKIQKEKKNLWDLTDPAGNHVIQMERKAVENPEGDFIRYYWKKPDGSTPVRKTSFIRGFDRWQWMVGTGFYEDGIDTRIEQLHHELVQGVKVNMLKILLLLFSLAIIILIIGHFSLRKMNNNISVFLNFFRTAVGTSSSIPLEDINFHEFREMARSANEMILKYNQVIERLQESEEKYRLLAKNLGEGVVIFDNQHRFQYVNAAAAKIFGFTEDSFQNHTLDEFLVSTDDNGEITIHNANGEKRHLLVTSTIRYDKAGNKTGTFEIIRDITKTRIMENERDENRERMRLLYHILRHDLANNFAVINSAVRLYAKESDQKLSDEILRQVHKGINTIDMVRNRELALSKSGTPHPELLSKVLAQLKMDYRQIPIEISGSCAVQVDDVFYSVFDNLINNTITHAKASKISIHMEKEGEHCKITFADDGTGIPDDVKIHVFDDGYFYGDTGHTGIGLHIVKKVIERYGGSISIRDNHPHGTIFEILLNK